MQKSRDPVSAQLIDQLGSELVREQFDLSPQLLYMWRQRGVPVVKRIAFHNFALANGITPPPEFLAKIGIAA
jgi:hypothetical protein